MSATLELNCSSVGSSVSLVYLKTPLDEMLDARAWLEDIRDERRSADYFIWDWPTLSYEPILKG